jgi:hypothetical protein
MTANGAGAPYAQSGAAAGRVRGVQQKMFLQKQIIEQIFLYFKIEVITNIGHYSHLGNMRC